VPFASALLWRTATLGSHSFWELFAYAFGVLFIFNLVDLLILDWLIVCWLEPRWVILPGTEHIVIPKQYLHYFKGVFDRNRRLSDCRSCYRCPSEQSVLQTDHRP